MRNKGFDRLKITYPSFKQIIKINRLYDGLSKEDKENFNPLFLGRIRQKFFRQWFNKVLLYLSSISIMKKTLSRLNLPYFLSLITVKGYSIIGFAYIRVHINKEGWLGIFVLPSYRNKGIGKETVKSLIRKVRKKNIKIVANVSPKNEIAIHFYTSLGFKEVRRNECSMRMEYEVRK